MMAEEIRQAAGLLTAFLMGAAVAAVLMVSYVARILDEADEVRRQAKESAERWRIKANAPDPTE